VVIRYDSAHGFAHIDRYYLDGSKVKKELNLNLSTRRHKYNDVLKLHF
jgi:hypothetical protein